MTNYQHVKFTTCQKIKLYFYEILGTKFNKIFDKKNEIYEIYSKGKIQLIKELNILKIIRNLRNL
jgi:hypothetical protein